MTQALSGRCAEKRRRAIAWVFVSLCGLAVLGVVLHLGFALVVGPREDPSGLCAFSAPPQLNSNQVELTWSENLFTNTLTCTWSSIDDTESTTVTIRAY